MANDVLKTFSVSLSPDAVFVLEAVAFEHGISLRQLCSEILAEEAAEFFRTHAGYFESRSGGV